MGKKLLSLVVTLLTVVCLSSCKDPYECRPGDIDRDNDGRCHEQ